MLFVLFVVFMITSWSLIYEARQSDRECRATAHAVMIAYMVVGPWIQVIWPYVVNLHAQMETAAVYTLASLILIGSSTAAQQVYADIRAKINEE
jgi:hypothetical protein